MQNLNLFRNKWLSQSIPYKVGLGHTKTQKPVVANLQGFASREACTESPHAGENADYVIFDWIEAALTGWSALMVTVTYFIPAVVRNGNMLICKLCPLKRFLNPTQFFFRPLP